jgi:hypothetical protein
MTTMIDERLARLRTRRNNLHRYRALLKTRLTDLERQYLNRRVSEEQAAMEMLTASTFPTSLSTSNQAQRSPGTV